MSTYPFFFNDTATTEIYTLSLHDALPISFRQEEVSFRSGDNTLQGTLVLPGTPGPHPAVAFVHCSGALGRVDCTLTPPLLEHLASPGHASILWAPHGMRHTS